MIPLRLYLYAAGALALVGLLWYAHHAIDQGGYKRAQAEFQKALEVERAHQAEMYIEVDHEYQNRLAQVKADAVRELAGKPIRMCKPASALRVPGAAGSPDDGAASGGSALSATEDLRPRIVLRGETCEQLRQQVLQLQDWIRQTAASPPSK